MSSSATFNSAVPARPVSKPIAVTIRGGIVAQPNPGGGGAAIAASPLGRPSAKGPRQRDRGTRDRTCPRGRSVHRRGLRRGLRRGPSVGLRGARRRQGRGAHVGTRPRRRDPGRRRRCDRVRPHLRPLRGRASSRPPASPRPPPRAPVSGRTVRAARRRRRSAPERRAHRPRGRRQGAQGRAPDPRRRRGPLGRPGHHPGHGPVLRQPPSHPGGEHRRHAGRATTR